MDEVLYSVKQTVLFDWMRSYSIVGSASCSVYVDEVLYSVKQAVLFVWRKNYSRFIKLFRLCGRNYSRHSTQFCSCVGGGGGAAAASTATSRSIMGLEHSEGKK